MSAKITVILYIAICFEVGIVLIFAPWTGFWGDNFFLDYLTARLHWQFLVSIIQSSYFKGTISALGIVNLLICFGEVKNFRQTVSLLSEVEKKEDEAAQAQKNAALPDNQP